MAKRVLEIGQPELQSLGLDWQSLAVSTEAEKVATAMDQSDTRITFAAYSGDSELATTAHSEQTQSLQTCAVTKDKMTALLDSGNVLSSPRVTTLESIPASIHVGSDVPYVAEVECKESDADGIPVVCQPVTKVLSTGLKIDLKGTLSEDCSEVQTHLDLTDTTLNSLTEVPPKLSNLAEGFDVRVQVPNYAVHHVNANLDLPKDQLVAIHCGTQAVSEVVDYKIPILSDIPLVSRVFKSRGITRKDKTTVVILKCSTSAEQSVGKD